MPACTRSSCPRCRRWYSPRKRRAPNDTGSDKVCRLTWENTFWDSPRNEVTSPQVVDPLAPEPTDFFDRGTGRIQDVRAELS